jgi:hypothetical protein
MTDLLKALRLNGAMATIDVAGCQNATVGQVSQRGGDYVVSVKGHQKGLRDIVTGAFEMYGAEASGSQARSLITVGYLHRCVSPRSQRCDTQYNCHMATGISTTNSR